jgi:hypothetical protein
VKTLRILFWLIAVALLGFLLNVWHIEKIGEYVCKYGSDASDRLEINFVNAILFCAFLLPFFVFLIVKVLQNWHKKVQIRLILVIVLLCLTYFFKLFIILSAQLASYYLAITVSFEVCHSDYYSYFSNIKFEIHDIILTFATLAILAILITRIFFERRE